MAAVGAAEQGREAGRPGEAGAQQARPTPSAVLAALGGLGQGPAGWRAQGLEGVAQGQGPWGSVGCSPPPLSGLPAWAPAAASC